MNFHDSMYALRAHLPPPITTPAPAMLQPGSVATNFATQQPQLYHIPVAPIAPRVCCCNARMCMLMVLALGLVATASLMPGFLTDAFGSGVKSAGLAAGAIGLLAALVPMVVLLMDNVKFIKPAAITYFCGSLLYFAVLGVAIKQLLSFIDQPFTEKSKLSDMIETNLPELAVKYAASSLVYSLGCWIAVDFIIVATCTYYMNAYRVFKAKLAEYEEKMGGMAHGGIVVAMGLGGPGAANKV